MAFYFSEEQMVEAARAAFRDYSTWSHREFASQIEHGATLELWTNAAEEANALGEALKAHLGDPVNA